MIVAVAFVSLNICVMYAICEQKMLENHRIIDSIKR